MISVAAGFVLLTATLALVVLKARKLPWCWGAAALTVASGSLFAMHAVDSARADRVRDAQHVDSCNFLTSELHSLASEFQMQVFADKQHLHSPVDGYRLRDRYAALVTEYRTWLEGCIPKTARCLPRDLDDKTVGVIERATSGLQDGARCP